MFVQLAADEQTLVATPTLSRVWKSGKISVLFNWSYNGDVGWVQGAAREHGTEGFEEPRVGPHASEV